MHAYSVAQFMLFTICSSFVECAYWHWTHFLYNVGLQQVNVLNKNIHHCNSDLIVNSIHEVPTCDLMDENFTVNLSSSNTVWYKEQTSEKTRNKLPLSQSCKVCYAIVFRWFQLSWPDLTLGLIESFNLNILVQRPSNFMKLASTVHLLQIM